MKYTPLIRIRMPMHLSHCTRLDIEMTGRDGFGDRKVLAVHYTGFTATSHLWWRIKHVVRVLMLRALERGRLFLVNAIRDGSWERTLAISSQATSVRLTLKDILVLFVNVLEHLRRQAEVLRNDRLRSVLDPLVQQKGRVFGEVAVIEDEEELRTILAQALERVRMTGGKVPQVALLEVVDERAAIGVQSRDANLACGKSVLPLTAVLAADRPSSTYAHSASLCQCNSRITPGSRRIFTPAISLDAGSSRTVVCLVQPPSSMRIWESEKLLYCISHRLCLASWSLSLASYHRRFGRMP